MSFKDRQRLENAIISAKGEVGGGGWSDETMAWLAQLMTIWASGYLEASCREVLLEYTRKRADHKVVDFVSHELNRFQSPKMNNILTLIRRFDAEAASQLGDFVEGEIKDSIDSIVGIRHQIAHGRSANISVGRITRYFDNAKKCTRKMAELLR